MRRTETLRGRLWAAVIAAVLVIAGCVAVPSDLPERASEIEQSTLEAWQADPGVTTQSEVEAALARDLYAMFSDQRALDLVEEAMRNNSDLRAAALRVEAIAQAGRIVDAQRIPNATLQGEGRSARSNGIFSDSFALSADVSWSADLWGRLAAQSAAAGADFEAARADREAAQISISNFVLRGWVSLWRAKQEKVLLDRRIADLEALHQLTSDAFRLGLVRLEDRADAKAQVDLAYAQRAAAIEAEKNASRVLEQLLGRPPVGMLDGPASAPEVDFPAIASPAQVLAARPDLRAAYDRLEGSVFRARSAARAMLPDVTLGGGFAHRSGDFSDVGQWNAVLGLGQVLFDGGALIAQARIRGIEAEIQLEAYRNAVLTAIGEVETALSNEASLRAQITSTRAALMAAHAALSDGQSSYRTGLIDFRTLLSRRLQVSELDSSLVALRAAWMSNRLQLALAMGFGPPSSQE